MKYKALLFDASLTLWHWDYDPALVHLKKHEYDPALVLLQAVQGAGIPVDEQALRSCYDKLRPTYAPRWRAFESNGHGATATQVQAHFDQQNEELLRLLELADLGGQIMAAIERAFAQWRPSLFSEVYGVLETLHSHGVAMAIVSNGWRQAEEAERLGVAKFFSAIVGSAHVGYHKPQARIFELALTELGNTPEQAMYVGDDYDDDVVGAKSAGITPILLDRDGGTEREDVLTIRSLRELPSLVI